MNTGVLFGCFGSKIDGKSKIPGGLINYQTLPQLASGRAAASLCCAPGQILVELAQVHGQAATWVKRVGPPLLMLVLNKNTRTNLAVLGGSTG